MKILITGVAGFIGSHAAKALSEKNYSVVGIDNFNDYYNPKLKQDRIKHIIPKNVEFIEGDILDKELLDKLAKKFSFDCIVHLAAQAGVRYSIENPDAYIQNNIQGTNNIFELAKKYEIPKIIFASSSSVYGSNKKVPFSELDAVDNPISLYAATKIMNELQARTYNNLYGIDMIGLRFFTVYGPWGRPDMALFKFTKNILEAKPIDVYNYGNMKRGFTFIDDIVNGVVRAIECDIKGIEIFNLGNSNTVELNYFIELIEKELGKKAKKKLCPMQPGDIPETYADIKKAKNLLEWIPKVSIEKGIKNFVAWYRKYYR